MVICTAVPPYALVDAPYPADLQAAAKGGTLKPNDDTGQNPSYAFAAGGVISTADDLAIWMRALAGGKLFDANHQRQWLDSLEPQDPSKPLGQKYRCPATTRSWATIQSTMSLW
jgi:D-alanyl-D-alanine carboxypeptidase